MAAITARHRGMVALALATLISGALASCAPAVKQPPPAAPPAAPPSPQERAGGEYHATAYSIRGRTASGIISRLGIVAADPDVLPLGSRIQISDAGSYDGEYVVADTGRKIQGRRIDIYLPDHREARRFGKKTVRVRVLHYGQR